MRIQEFEYLQGKVIEFISEKGYRKSNDSKFMYSMAISFLSGFSPDIKLKDGVEIAESAINYINEHKDE